MKIIVLHNCRSDHVESNYLLKHLCDAWTEDGHETTFLRNLHNPLPPADVVVLHIDLTTVPLQYLDALPSHPAILNRKVASISKRLFSSTILYPGDSYAGAVIVKTSANYGGLPERRAGLISRLYPSGGGPLTLWRHARSLRKYPIFPSMDAVPSGVWSNEHLIVERFLPECSLAGDYCLRQLVFLGNRDSHYMSYSHEPVIKSHNIRSRTELPVDDIPESLRRMRKELGFDYGKFDYGIHDGQVVLYDLNKTPGAPRTLDRIADLRNRIKALSRGIGHYHPNP